MRNAVAYLPPADDAAALDALAADYADIYLTYKLRVSPCESVWLDEDGLIMQEPMFQIREWYKKYGLAAQNWRERTDDHLVLQLHFVSHLIGSGAGTAQLAEAARFLDEHLLRWIHPFAERVASRSATPFYAGLAALTAMYVEELRELLAELLGEPRPTAEEIEQRMSPAQAEGEFQDIPIVSVPATTPSW
jgi:TorA maturation chaperone TorD